MKSTAIGMTKALTSVTAKILRKRGDRYYLAPANSQEQFPDVELTEDSEIWGVIAGVVRRYDLA